MKTTNIIAMALLGMFTTFTATAQNNVGIGTSAPDASAALEIESTTQGLLPPRLNGLQIINITSPAEGLMVYNTTDKKLNVFNGVNWEDMTGSSVTFYVPVYLRLNGETPLAIYNSLVTGGSTPSAALDSLYGKTYQGGLIAYLNTTTGTGLIAAATDQSTGIQWTMSAHQSTTVPNGATDITNGSANTASIVAQAGVPAAGGDNYAAYLCDTLTLGGYTDWYLPSKDELYLLYKNLHRYGCSAAVPGGTDNTPCATSVGGFANNYYWSSTEYDFSAAWKQDFYFGSQYSSGGKSFILDVRAVRAF